MNEFVPVNDLDRAILALARSRAATPDFYRALVTGRLWFLLRFHPDLDGETLTFQNGSPMPFIRFTDAEGEVIPLFSSEARVEEALAKGKIPPRQFMAGSMPAREAMEVLGAVGLRAVVNQFCATGAITIPPDMMRDLANGKALAPISPGQTVQKSLGLLDPADYPTHLIQPLFEYMRRHPPFRAAWVFGRPPSQPPPTDGLAHYDIMVLMSPRDVTAIHDFNMIVQAAKGAGCAVELSCADENDAAHMKMLFEQARPFYVAVDYQPPADPSLPDAAG